MAKICKICRVRKGSSHKMSCDYYRYHNPVVWIDSVTLAVIDGNSSTFNDYSSTANSDSSSSSCDSGGF